MLEVYFASDKEVIYFCEQLFQYNKHIELHWKKDEEWGHHIIIEGVGTDGNMIDSVVNSLQDVFYRFRQTSLLKEIITDTYYFTEKNEVGRILDLTRWMLQDKHKVPEHDPASLLWSLLHANLEYHETIHFSSIIHFRLQPYKTLLTRFIEHAIDEFKREENHQSFLQEVREYVLAEREDYAIIHVMQGENFRFVDDDGKPLAKSDLSKIMNDRPLYMVGLDIEEWNLAPLVAMNPSKIMLYGDDPTDPKTLTVRNVFEERVVFKPASAFPFSSYLEDNL